MALTLDVMLATTASRVDSIPELPRMEGVRYIVCVQDPQLKLQPDQLKALERPDVDLRIYHDSGLAVNRNHGLDAATADLVLVADDDLIFYPEGLRELISRFEKHPEVDFFTFRAKQPETRIYPPDGHDLSHTFRFYNPISFEMAFRRNSIPTDLKFSPLTGIGAPYLGSGEDDLFFHNALKRGLKGRFADITPLHHPGETTSVHSAAKLPVVRAKGALMRIIRGNFAALIRLPLEAWRSPVPFPKALVALAQGYFYSIKHRNEL